ncbi:MAG: hypothetical protein P4L63_02450 [Candidatus Pacebacteria bacterium]|nr:hypothetical protein [Candidatus Paceibacterota bacterium]
MKNNFSKILILLSALLFISSCAIFVFLYREINTNNSKAESDTAAWQTEALRRDDITSLNNSLAQVSNDRSLLQTHFAQSSDVVPFLNTIEQLAPPTGTVAQVESVSSGANNTGLVVELNASGSFQQLYKFLTLLENSPYELNFLSMDIHKSTVLDASTNPTSSSGTKSSSTGWNAVFQIQLLSFVP